ncbi:hypothetical protein DFJ58DRAFT_748204 [Suillus subalutaceus]|uniref:uncharacterized protein n=1 Tax=Suillus subalutaceus TaxID=48586 RepID=UPI001B87AFA7|nr:uncharacterized protein DFJ58DRAFT_748204 [Suillus subalutaceus]KAG1842249.1 hypothetical protein DFJ58DRAFT_748204 [Suillus subalutaceus]
MSHIIRLGPNATLKLIPPSPDCCDTCKLTDRSPPKIIIPSLAQRLANLKRKHSSEFGPGLLPVLKKSRRRTKKTGDKSNTPRLMTKTQPLQKQTLTAVDNKDESDDGNVPDDEAEEEGEESQSPAEAVSDAPHPSLRIKSRLPKRQTDTAKDNNTTDDKPQEKKEEKEEKEDEDSYQEDSSSESSDESEDEYIPPKRQRKCLQAIPNSSPPRTRTSTSASAAKHDKGAL